MAVGIDIGTTSIKVVWTRKSGKKWELVSAGAAKAPSRGILSDSPDDLSNLAVAIKKLIADANVKQKDVAVGLLESEVSTRLIEMPSLSDSELASAVTFEAEQYIPRPVEEMNLAHEVVSKATSKDGKMKVLLAATPKVLVDKYVRVLEMAGMRVVVAEGELMAAARAVGEKDGEYAVVDMGASGTDIGVISARKLVFTRSISTGGEALTRAVSVGLSMDPQQAENYKKTYGLNTAQLEGKVAASLRPVVESMADEIKKTLEFYRSQSGGEVVKSLVLTGGTAGLPEIIPLIAGRVGCEVVIGDPFWALEKTPQATDALSGYGPLYPIAVGLSMREG